MVVSFLTLPSTGQDPTIKVGVRFPRESQDKYSIFYLQFQHFFRRNTILADLYPHLERRGFRSEDFDKKRDEEIYPPYLRKSLNPVRGHIQLNPVRGHKNISLK